MFLDIRPLSLLIVAALNLMAYLIISCSIKDYKKVKKVIKAKCYSKLDLIVSKLDLTNRYKW